MQGELEYCEEQDEHKDRLTTKKCSIFVMRILCFWFGRAARDYSIKAEAAEESGDYVAAADYRRQARKWNILGIVIGTLLYVVAGIILLAGLSYYIYFKATESRYRLY